MLAALCGMPVQAAPPTPPQQLPLWPAWRALHMRRSSARRWRAWCTAAGPTPSWQHWSSACGTTSRWGPPPACPAAAAPLALARTAFPAQAGCWLHAAARHPPTPAALLASPAHPRAGGRRPAGRRRPRHRVHLLPPGRERDCGGAARARASDQRQVWAPAGGRGRLAQARARSGALPGPLLQRSPACCAGAHAEALAAPTSASPHTAAGALWARAAAARRGTAWP